MNLFGGRRDKAPATPPTIDQAMARVRELRRGQAMRGRASAMLVKGQGDAAPVAKREVTGN